jgi:VWFA-related protein
MRFLDQERKVTVRNKTEAQKRPRTTVAGWTATVLVAGCLGGCLSLGARRAAAQSSGGQAQPSQSAPNQPAPGPPAQNQPAQSDDIPDAPTVQPSAPTPEPPPIPKPEEKKPASEDKNPWTNQPNSKPAEANPFPEDANPPAPAMPPVKTVPPGTAPKSSHSQDELYTYVIHSNFVQVPVTVKDREGRMVDGLLSTDFSVKENGTVQKLSYFSSDPFALSVAVVLDLGMPDADVQKVNQTFPALVGAFAPYDEIALYTYSSTVSEVSDFAGAGRKLTQLLNQMKTERGHNNGVPVMSGPLAPNGPIVNGVPVGSPTQPVYTPPKESHVLNDAILRAALDLSKRDRRRRKIIFVISDGREYGSEASYRDVLRVLLSNEIQVKAVALDSGALPGYSKIERLHLPHEGYSDILPKYTAATGGGLPYKELTQSAIEDSYAQAMGDARNQYTLGYTPARPKTPTASPYRVIEVLVNRPGLKIYARDGYYPAPAAR